MNRIQYQTCPLCQSGHFYDYIETKDYSVSQENFIIKECDECHLLFTDNIPDLHSIGRYYQSDAYISHTNKANNPVNILYKVIREYTLHRKIKLIQKFSGHNLLDIGCGTGMFLQKAYKADYKITGVENDQLALTNQSQIVNNQCFTSIDELPKTDNFDIITLWHVLEHIHDLTRSFSDIVKHLKPEGHIVLALPNASSPDAHHYKQYWAAWDVPRHLYHFRKEQVHHLMEKNNIELIQILPMKFDAFYVSMLSEKYKKHSLVSQLVKGFVNGLRSNFKANTSNYSSLIYIGRKL